jgi:hypothetical protein
MYINPEQASFCGIIIFVVNSAVMTAEVRRSYQVYIIIIVG